MNTDQALGFVEAMGRPTTHEEKCDCGACCVDCTLVPRRESLDDCGRCSGCALEAQSFAGMARMDSAKAGA